MPAARIAVVACVAGLVVGLAPLETPVDPELEQRLERRQERALALERLLFPASKAPLLASDLSVLYLSFFNPH